MQAEIDELCGLLASNGLLELVEECRAKRYTLKVLQILQRSNQLSKLTAFEGEFVLLDALVTSHSSDLRLVPSDSNSTRPSGSSTGSPSAGCSSAGSSSAKPSSSSSTGSSSAGSTSAGTSSKSSTGSRLSAGSTSVAGSSSSGSSVISRKRGNAILSSAAAKVSRLEAGHQIEELDLSLLLDSDDCCKLIKQNFSELWQKYEDSLLAPDEEPVQPPILSENQRSKIVATITEHLLKISDTPDHKYFPLVCSKIVAIFPNECVNTYYVAPKHGKLPNCIRNTKSRNKLKASFGQVVNCVAESSCTPAASNLNAVLRTPINDEMKSAARWLLHGRTPWPLVIEKWKLCAPIRFRSIFGQTDEAFINSYLEEWPILEHKSGNELILHDFKLLREEASPKLISRWDEFVTKTLLIASRDVKDKVARALVEQAKSLQGDCLGLAILQILPWIRTNHTYMNGKQKIKVNVDIARDNYLLVVEKDSDLISKLKERRTIISSEEDGGGQPLIIVVGSTKKINSIHVSFAKLRYKLSSIPEALDLYMKLFHVFHIKYPVQIIHILMVIQRAIYEFSTEFDSNILHSWIKIYQ